MPTIGNVFVQTLPGHVRVVIEGDDPSQPWEIILTPQAAFSLGNELRIKSEDLGVKMKTPVSARSNAQPARRPPTNSGGPQTSADGVPPILTPPAGHPASNNNLLGDTF